MQNIRTTLKTQQESQLNSKMGQRSEQIFQQGRYTNGK